MVQASDERGEPSLTKEEEGAMGDVSMRELPPYSRDCLGERLKKIQDRKEDERMKGNIQGTKRLSRKCT